MQQEAQRSGSSMKYMNTVRLCINSIILLTSSASSCHKNTNAAATALAASVALNVRLAVLAVVHNTRLMQLLLLLQIKNPDQTKERWMKAWLQEQWTQDSQKNTENDASSENQANH